MLSQPEAEVRIEIVLSDRRSSRRRAPSDDLVLSWEYFDGKQWRILGRSGPKGTVRSPANPSGASSTAPTRFTKTGVVTFRVPRDMHAGEVNGEDNYWMRARIEIGDFGQPGSYMLDGDKWVWRDDRPLQPPSFKSVGFKYRADLQYLKHVLSYNDFRYPRSLGRVEDRVPPVPAVQRRPRRGRGAVPRLERQAAERSDLALRPARRRARRRSDADRADAEFLKNYYADRDAVWEAEQRVVWEYCDGTNWAPLVVIDGTKNFTDSGFVDFVGPDDHQKTMKFTEDRYWIRARLEMGGYVKPPRIARILTNTVEARQRRDDPRRDPRLAPTARRSRPSASRTARCSRAR